MIRKCVIATSRPARALVRAHENFGGRWAIKYADECGYYCVRVSHEYPMKINLIRRCKFGVVGCWDPRCWFA
jgi:hypothetical protein